MEFPLTGAQRLTQTVEFPLTGVQGLTLTKTGVQRLKLLNATVSMQNGRVNSSSGKHWQLLQRQR